MISFKEFNELVELESKGNATAEQLQALEPYKVKRAIFFAAGFGSRLVPLTLEKPKPLIKVHGERMIDTLLDAVLALGIEDITIIRGYKKEMFVELDEKYPMVKYIDNDIYDKANNISSAILAKDMLENTVVLESDLVLYNKNALQKYVYNSFYLGIKMDESDDWCFKTTDTKIDSVHIGGKDIHQMVGISYWNQKDGKQLSEDIVKFYEQEDGAQRFWDEVSLIDYAHNYDVYVKEVSEDDIIEIDTYDELLEIDSSYR